MHPKGRGRGWVPCAPSSELQGDDRPVLGLLSVTVLVKAQLHRSFHGLDLGSAVPVQTLHLGLAPLTRPLSWGFYRPAGVAVQVVVSVYVAVQALCIQLLLPPSFFSVPLSLCKVLAELFGDFHIAQVTFYLCI